MSLVKILISIGIVFIVAGILVWLLGNKFSWFGKLPGDIVVDKENFKFYFPITTMIIVSVLLSLIVYIIKRF